MHQSVFFPIAKCYVSYVQGLMQNYNQAGGLTGSSLSILRGRGKAVHILPSLDPTLALLLVGFTEYDDDDDELKFGRSPLTSHPTTTPKKNNEKKGAIYLNSMSEFR
ncbi:hypothetical protein Hanom_Chr05g00406571 [Helianthus anomalus]